MQTEITDKLEKIKDLHNEYAKRSFFRRNQTVLRLLFVLLLFVLYLSVGAAIFTAIEAPGDLETFRKLRKLRQKFLAQHKECLADADLEHLIEMVVEASHRGVSALRNVSSDPNWSFGQSFFFSGTLITTVGYGHVSPITQGGKAFTIIYALLGIPITLSLLSALVERAKIPSLWFMGVLNARLGHLYHPSQIRFVHLAILFSVLLVFLFVVPASIFMSIEPGWNFLDAFYYCFISLTTIGLGDFIPGDSPSQPNRGMYKIFITAYLLIGLCCMMLLLSTIYDIPQLNLGHFFLVKQEEQSYNDPERLQLANKGLSGPKYTQHVDEVTTPSNASPVSITPSLHTTASDDNQYNLSYGQTPYH